MLSVVRSSRLFKQKLTVASLSLGKFSCDLQGQGETVSGAWPGLVLALLWPTVICHHKTWYLGPHDCQLQKYMKKIHS